MIRYVVYLPPTTVTIPSGDSITAWSRERADVVVAEPGPAGASSGRSPA
jgi:hypothetical protein